MKLKLSYLIIFTALLFIFGCTSKEMKKAKEFMEASMYEQAILLLEIEIQDNPKNAEASYLLGKCYIETSNQYKVEDCFKRAILLDTDFKEEIGSIYFDKSLEYFKKDNLRSAERFYEEGLKYNPTYKENFAKQLFDYTISLSETLTESDKPIELFTIVDNISSEYKIKISNKAYTLASSFIEKGFIDEGFKYADFGINYDSKHIKDVSNLYFKQGENLLTIQNKPNECFYYFENCIKLNPSRKQEIGNIYYNKAQTYESTNEINLLLIFAQKSVEINPEFNSWYQSIKEKFKPKIAANGLVAYWNFDEGQRNTVIDCVGKYDGAITGTSATMGIINGARSFRNSKDNIAIPTNLIDLDLHGSSQISISLWIKRSRLYTTQWIFYARSNRDNAGIDLSLGTDNKFRIGGRSRGADRFQYQIGSMVLNSTSDWYHIVAIYDYANKKLITYVNGVKDADGSVAFGSSTLNYTSIYSNFSTDNSKYAFKGIIDEVGFWNRALTMEEVKRIYNNGEGLSYH